MSTAALPVAAPETGPSAAALKAAVCAETARQCAERYGARLRAIVLTGSLAREEATVVATGATSALLGDAEFLLVFHGGAPLPTDVDLGMLRQAIRAHLAQRGLSAELSLAAVRPSYLRRLTPHIFAYELARCGEVVWGDAGVLALVPPFSASDIPLEDAWRLLCNRMVEALEVAGALADRPASLPWAVRYRAVKLHLDMATSLLLFVGAYEPTYRARAARLERLAASAEDDGSLPFPLGEFSERVLACTQVKLLGVDASAEVLVPGDGARGRVFWAGTASYAHLLWRWELARLAGAPAGLSDRALLECWMRRQPLAQRLRGWLHVARRCGWHRGWRDWGRWARRAWRASPRYWVYAAASDLFFRLPRLVLGDGGEAADRDWQDLRACLPVVPGGPAGAGAASWPRLASEIVWNYHEFLVETRA